jgi:hypothetical protein
MPWARPCAALGAALGYLREGKWGEKGSANPHFRTHFDD